MKNKTFGYDLKVGTEDNGLVNILPQPCITNHINLGANICASNCPFFFEIIKITLFQIKKNFTQNFEMSFSCQWPKNIS